MIQIILYWKRNGVYEYSSAHGEDHEDVVGVIATDNLEVSEGVECITSCSNMLES